MRHPSLIPLSHDHHHALVAAADAIRGAEGTAGECAEAAQRFGVFFTEHAAPHFRAEEEELFPLLAQGSSEAVPEPLVQALVEHARLRALAAELRDPARAATAATLAEAGELLRAHVRLEERVLFPLIEADVAEEELAALRLPEHGGPPTTAPVVVDLEAQDGRGAVWSTSTADLNVNHVVWPPGEGVGTHVNAERDVLLVVIAGTGEVVVDGTTHAVVAGQAIIVPSCSERSVTAGEQGIRYVSAHLRRPPGIPLE